MKQFNIPVHYIRQYIFCPRIPYFLETLKVQPSQPLWVKQGLQYHKRQEILSRSRTLQRFYLITAIRNFNVVLYSEQYDIQGISDLILETKNAVYPVEFKTSIMAMNRGHKLQLYAYGVMAMDKFSKALGDGFILHQKKGVIQYVPFSPSLKQDFDRTVRKLKKSIADSLLPFSPASYAQCSQCEFLNFCNDRF